MERASQEAEAKKDNMIKKAKNEIGQIIMDEKDKIRQEKVVVLKEIKSEVADLVALGIEKMLDKKIDKKQDKELIKKIIK